MNALPKLSPKISRIAATAAGAGLKPEHYAQILATRPDLGFFEIHAENYMSAGGPSHRWLAAIREIYPLSVHGVGLSLGSSEPLDRERLARLARVVALYQPALVSEHLAWSDFSGRAFPDLLPLPYDEASLFRTADRIDATQNALGRKILIENPATYLRFAGDGLPEPQFLAELCALSGCGLLLDVNNVHVSAVNHGFRAGDYLEAFPFEHVGEIHLAGFAEAQDAQGAFLIDNHGGQVSDEVWALYEHVVRRAAPRPTLIEWDSDVPEWEVLFAETRKAKAILADESKGRHARPRAGHPRQGANRDDNRCAPRRRVDGRDKPGHDGFQSKCIGQFPEGAPKTGAVAWQAQFAAALQNPALSAPNIFYPCDLASRFAVYRNNSAVASIEALKEQFPTVARLVGDEAFYGLARAFVKECPPRSPVLGEYGADFPRFLECFLAGVEGGDATPYLPDSARLDWACLAALRAPEAPPCPVTRLAELDPAGLGEQKLLLHPSLALVASRWPILSIRDERVEDFTAETALVLRPGAELVITPCPPGPAAFLRACAEGKTLGEADRAASAEDENFDFGQTLVELTRIGAIVDFAA